MQNENNDKIWNAFRLLLSNSSLDVKNTQVKTEEQDDAELESKKDCETRVAEFTTIGKYVDVQDGESYGARWCVARIVGVQLNKEDNKTPISVRLHFEGWDDRYDETVSLTSCPPRIAPLDSYTLGAYTGGKGTKSINKHINEEYMEMRLKMFLRHVCTSVDVSKILTSLRELEDESNDMDTIIQKAVQRYKGEYTELARIVESSVGMPPGMFLSQHLRIPLSGGNIRTFSSFDVSKRQDDDDDDDVVVEEESRTTKLIRAMLRVAVHVEVEEIRDIFKEHSKYASRNDAKELHRSDGSNATTPTSPLFGRFGIVASRRRSSGLPKLRGGVAAPFDLRVEHDILLTLNRAMSLTSLSEINNISTKQRFAIGQRVEARFVTETGKLVRRDRNWYGGVITAHRPDGTYEIHYDDGDFGRGITERDVLNEARDNVMRALVNVRIAVAFSGGWYQGVVSSYDVACKDGQRFSCVVNYDDGDERRHNLQFGRRNILYQVLATTPDERKRLVGTRIEMRRVAGLFRGVVTHFDEITGKSRVVFDDGETLEFDLSDSETVAIATSIRNGENFVYDTKRQFATPPWRVITIPWPKAPVTRPSFSVASESEDADEVSTPEDSSATAAATSMVQQLAMREGYETKVATLLSLGFDASVEECYSALISSVGNMERAVEILLENQSRRGESSGDAGGVVIEEEEGKEEREEEEEEEEEEEKGDEDEDENKEEEEKEEKEKVRDENALFGDVHDRVGESLRILLPALMGSAKEDMDEFVSISETLLFNVRLLTYRDELRQSKDFNMLCDVLNPEMCEWYTSLPVKSSKTSRRNRRRRRRSSSSGSGENMTKMLGSRHADIVLNLLQCLCDVVDERVAEMMLGVIVVHGKRTCCVCVCVFVCV